MRMMNPSVMVSRLDLVVLEFAAAGIVFCQLPQGFWNIWVFIELRGGGKEIYRPHDPPGHAWALLRALVYYGPHGPPPADFLGSQVVFWSKKISKKFNRVWTPFDMDILRSKKQEKNINWH